MSRVSGNIVLPDDVAADVHRTGAQLEHLPAGLDRTLSRFSNLLPDQKESGVALTIPITRIGPTSGLALGEWTSGSRYAVTVSPDGPDPSVAGARWV